MALKNFWFILLLLCNYGFAQTLATRDFEKICSTANFKEYLAKKDFTVKSDGSTKTNGRVKFFNRSTKEILTVTFNKGSEGDTAFEIEYLIATDVDYKKFVQSLTKNNYVIKTLNRYEKFTSTYEKQNITLKGIVYYKDGEYYGVMYSYYAGKEISEPSNTTH